MMSVLAFVCGASPISYVGRGRAWLFTLFATVALVWFCCSNVEEVSIELRHSELTWKVLITRDGLVRGSSKAWHRLRSLPIPTSICLGYWTRLRRTRASVACSSTANGTYFGRGSGGGSNMSLYFRCFLNIDESPELRYLDSCPPS